MLRNRYKIMKYLGGGGFGDTYLAEDWDLPGRPSCVVKHLKPKQHHPAALSIARRLFFNEAQILHKLGNDHDQMPRLFAHFEEGGQFYLVQEFIDGDNLSKEFIPGKPLSEHEVWQLLRDILEALVVVHQHNVIHRDIKPQNVMRRQKDGKIVLIDFGAVKEIGALEVNSQGETSITVAIGSPGYMPSEQANGKPRLSSDIYAIGMLGIQALTGLMPSQLQEDKHTGEVIWRHLTQVSPRLADVLDTMVRYDFRQRYQSATEALQALASTVVLPCSPQFSSFPIAPPIPPTAPKLIPGKILVGLGIVTIVSLAVLTFLMPSPTPLPTTLSSTSIPTATPSSTASPAPPLILLLRPDYARLQNLLTAGNWREADLETTRKMLEVIGRKKEGYLTIEDISKFPCQDLRMIDQLWTAYSNQRFGFSIQKRLWESVGGRPGVDDYYAYNTYGERVGWRVDGKWLTINQVTYTNDAPLGHLPFQPYSVIVFTNQSIDSLENVRWGTSSLSQRLGECNL